jgi:hypothetical protein
MNQEKNKKIAIKRIGTKFDRWKKLKNNKIKKKTFKFYKLF